MGVLGGSGLYDLEGLTDVQEHQMDTPFGRPSGPLVMGQIAGARIVFLSRHGRGHRLSPSEINYRANVHALKQLGVERVLSISAVGSLREGIIPGDLVLPDQFIDKTYRRASTFFGEGVVGHVSFADPVCPAFVHLVATAASETGTAVATGDERVRAHAPRTATGAAPSRRRSPRLHRGGCYVCMEGPQFSTRAESLLHRGWGADVIGMTAVTEAKLAREAEMCFAIVALSTDYDCWHPVEEAVTAASVIEVLRANIARAQDVVRAVVPLLAAPRTCGCARAAEHAILTDREAVAPEARERLRILYGRYL
ncbi:MAG: S-methyl-5'-thioadenosine phosphorylase [Deltaproteobacteria bacterium]|nr:S-methyl-5'-thioadenosine phosphorylase [Deltaproteobacteria bacterium]